MLKYAGAVPDISVVGFSHSSFQWHLVWQLPVDAAERSVWCQRWLHHRFSGSVLLTKEAASGANFVEGAPSPFLALRSARQNDRQLCGVQEQVAFLSFSLVLSVRLPPSWHALHTLGNTFLLLMVLLLVC